MKKLLLSVMILCCAMAMPMQAENTDISTLDNVVYIEPVSIDAGSQYTVSVKMKNVVEVEGFGFDLYLPDGVTVATDGDGFPMVELSKARTTPKKTNSFDAAFQSDGCLRVLAASTNASTISGNDGEVCLITVIVAANVSAGDYPMYLRNIAISDTEAQSHRTQQIESTINIIVSGSRLVLDETSTSVPSAAIGIDVSVIRTIKAGEWSTICLPFAMTEAQVKAAFGNDVELGDFVSYDTVEDDDENIVGITVDFDEATEIEANHPYIIKVAADISEFTVDNVDIEVEDEPCVEYDNGLTGKKRVVWGWFTGTYQAETVVPKNSLFLSSNKYWYSKGLTKMKGFRAYFEFVDLLTNVDEAGARIGMAFNNDDEATGIADVRSKKADVGSDTYDLQGRKVQNRVKPGLYVKGGKKLVVK